MWINKILAQSGDPIQNLVESEKELAEINNQAIDLQKEYLAVVNNFEASSFFNFNNVYFWFVIVGLLLLVFILWFIMLELKKPRDNKTKEEKVKEIIESEPIQKPIRKSKRKVIKVKVRKIKKKS